MKKKLKLNLSKYVGKKHKDIRSQEVRSLIMADCIKKKGKPEKKG